MPKLLGGGVVGGLLVALIGRRPLLYVWAVLITLGAAAGLGDFYKWGYDYGHKLDPHAAIKVPGMSYQPPVIGSKQLLNFHATSWPGVGGWIAIAALAIVVTVAVLEWRRVRAPEAVRSGPCGPREPRRERGARPPGRPR